MIYGGGENDQRLHTRSLLEELFNLDDVKI